ncbi:MAG: biotin/lipoyl-binding protein [Ruminiclostridium sp.]|nr:biotin/lipoyl-binding protein [Ruminiclostridium sp.]
MISIRTGNFPGFAKGLKIKLIMTAVLASFLFSGCTLLPVEEEVLAPPVREPQKVTYETMEVQKGTIEKIIRGTGYFVSVLRKDMFFQYGGGRLNKIYIKNGDKVKKGDLIAELEVGAIDNDIAFQKLVVRKAQINLDRVSTQSELNGGGNKYELELAGIDLEMEKMRLSNYYKELEKSKLLSEIDGEIVYLKDVKQGDIINAYNVIASVADPKVLQLMYNGDKVSDFRNGMKVDVAIDDAHFTGEVAATPLDAPPDADEVAKKSIKIKVDNLPDDIKFGDSASISLILEKKENVIVLPNYAVQNFAGRRFVNVLVNGIREERPVELGLQTGTDTEIIKGIEVGELVIVR